MISFKIMSNNAKFISKSCSELFFFMINVIKSCDFNFSRPKPYFCQYPCFSVPFKIGLTGGESTWRWIASRYTNIIHTVPYRTETSIFNHNSLYLSVSISIYLPSQCWMAMLLFFQSPDTQVWQNDYLQGTGCEMYTETLSPSFTGMTFPEASE